MFVINKSRYSKEAILYTSGRDIEQSEIVVCLNEDTCQWEFIGDADEVAKQEAEFDYQASPVIKTIRALLDESPERKWAGNAKKLLEAGERIFKIPIAPTSQVLSKELKKLKDLMFDNDRIVYTIRPNGNAGNIHSFYYAPYHHNEH